jgi:hypothetical protein
LAGISTDTKMSWLMGALSPFLIVRDQRRTLQI